MYELWIFKIPGSYSPPNSDISSLMYQNPHSPPQSGWNAVQLVADLDVPIYTPSWGARSWNTFPILIPFNLAPGSFTIDPSEHLGIWIRMSTPQGCPLGYGADWVADDGWPDYAMVVYDPTMPPYFQRLYKGHAPVLWLVEGETTPLSPRLDVYGFPQVGGTLLFQARQAGAAATVKLVVGTSYLTVQGLPCPLVVYPWTELQSRSASTMGDVTFVPVPITNDPVLLHQHLYFQAQTTAGGLLSEVVRLTIGGNVQ